MVDPTNISPSGATDKITAFLTSHAFTSAIGWLVLGIIVLAAGGYFIFWDFQRRKYKKIVVGYEIVGDQYIETIRDRAMTQKLGKGGFEILYLKKLKTWKLAYGGRVGKNHYRFFIDPIGYWYNGALSANIQYIDANRGMIPVITTNPTMRAQYTALEKHIDSLHEQKKSFWDKYGMWVLALGYVAVIGVFSWLSFREIGQFLGSGSRLADQMTQLASEMNKLAVNLNNAQPNGLVPGK